MSTEKGLWHKNDHNLLETISTICKHFSGWLKEGPVAQRTAVKITEHLSWKLPVQCFRLLVLFSSDTHHKTHPFSHLHFLTFLEWGLLLILPLSNVCYFDSKLQFYQGKEWRGTTAISILVINDLKPKIGTPRNHTVSAQRSCMSLHWVDLMCTAAITVNFPPAAQAGRAATTHAKPQYKFAFHL